MADTGIPVSTSENEEVEKAKPPHERQERRASAAGDISYHPGALVALYVSPCQRQKWGDTQILPRTNWGDLFFDLWYVAAAYNVGNILVASPTRTGALYFVGTFVPVMNMWMEKVYYDSRYVVGDDLLHRFFEVAVLLVLSTAVLHIRPASIMSNPQEHVDMFAFSLALLLGATLNLCRYIETFLVGKGQPEVIKQTSKRDIRNGLIALVFYLAATVIAGVKYYSQDDSGADYGENSTEASSYTDGHRLIAEASETSSYASSEYETTNVPIYLCLFGPIVLCLFQSVTVWCFFPSDGSHKEFTIPLNVDFTIHRNGEWIMLMLGESVLSLLIVDAPEGSNYYLTFYAGILTVILLQYLHYRSQPHHADDHAMRRNKDAAMIWRTMFVTYSASLVCVGVSYKLFMYEFTYQDDHRLLQDEALLGGIMSYERFLAGGGGSSLSPEQRRQSSANIFCVAMALVWFCQDTMLFLHNGFNRMRGQCYCQHSHKLRIKCAILLFLRLCLLVFIATLSLYETDPNHLALYGLAGVVAQLILRVVGCVIFPQPQVHHDSDGKEGEVDDEEEDPEENKWPNVTHAAVEKNENDDDDKGTD